MKFNFPNDSISEENKILINIFIDFIKTFGIITIDIPEVFFENGGIDNLNFLNIVEFVLILGNKFLKKFKENLLLKVLNIYAIILIKIKLYSKLSQIFNR